ncbi:MAG: hypothetical protein J5I98_18715 [Phaeodactylibacter sp.]|nr:hypothetical protein [Phaeodactylibacter sp.]
MFHRLLAILLIGALLLQSGREALIGLWFRANQESIAENYCINKDEPLLMCQGKCYLQKVIETEAPEDAPAPAKIPAPEERMPFFALPAPRLLKAGSSMGLTSDKSPFFYLAPLSAEVAFGLFRPPWL